jgi:hypothetical protein
VPIARAIPPPFVQREHRSLALGPGARGANGLTGSLNRQTMVPASAAQPQSAAKHRTDALGL